MIRRFSRVFAQYKAVIVQGLISAFPQLYFFFRKRIHGPLSIGNDSIIHIDRDAELWIDKCGGLEVNASWFEDSCRRYKSELRLAENSTLICHSDFKLYQGASVYVAPGAILELKGKQGFMNTNSTLNCFYHIEIGDDVGIGDNVTIADSDHHSINGKNPTAPIVIGNHVWICSNAIICAGVTIGDGAVVAAGAVVRRDVPAHSLVGGVPARVIREDVVWK